MARKKRRTRSIASTRITDEELMERLALEAPEVLKGYVTEGQFDGVIECLLKAPPDAENPHSYCRKCGEYHLKTHPHFVKS